MHGTASWNSMGCTAVYTPALCSQWITVLAMHFLHIDNCLYCIFYYLTHTNPCICTVCNRDSMKLMQLLSGNPKGTSKPGLVQQQIQAFISMCFSSLAAQKNKCCRHFERCTELVILILLHRIADLVSSLLKNERERENKKTIVFHAPNPPMSVELFLLFWFL